MSLSLISADFEIGNGLTDLLALLVLVDFAMEPTRFGSAPIEQCTLTFKKMGAVRWD